MRELKMNAEPQRSCLVKLEVKGKPTPKQALRAFCKNCLGLKQWDAEAIKNCHGDQCINPCPLHPYRMGTRLSVKTFRRFCLQCMGGDRKAVDECPVKSCPLYQYRFGTNPARRGTGASGESLKNVRESRKTTLGSKNAVHPIPKEGQQYPAFLE